MLLTDSTPYCHDCNRDCLTHRISGVSQTGEGASLKVDLTDDKFLTFTDFASTDNGDVDSAHALFEHLSDAA